MPREPLKIPPLPPLRMRAPQKLGSRGKMRKERRRPAAAAFASSDSIKAAFMAACEAGELEKVLDFNFWSAVIQIQMTNTNTIDTITNDTNFVKARAAIVLGVDVNMRAEKSRLSLI